MEESKRYWNEKYWVRHMRDDDLENIENSWVDKYENVISAHKGKLLLVAGDAGTMRCFELS